MADLSEQAMDEDIEVRIFGSVWVSLDERFPDGTWNVQYARGEPELNVREFRRALGIAGGMFAVDGETDVDGVRVRTSK